MTRLLAVRDLVLEIDTPRGPVRPVDGAALDCARGELVGIVGESGSGKSMLVRSIMGLLPPGSRLADTGSIVFDGQELIGADARRRRALWGRRIALIPQDPVTSLNPVKRVGTQITDALRRVGGMGRSEALARAAELLRDVGVSDPRARLSLYPHEMSGGMRQRVLIAIALANAPDLIIADEPTTALDVTIQRQILDLIDDLRRSRNIGVLLISHDLSVVAARSDRVLVMYGGRLVESLPSRHLAVAARHPYTRGLLTSHPGIDGRPGAELATIPGEPPDISARAARGCPFAPRCTARTSRCDQEMPDLISLSPDTEHLLACHHPAEVMTGSADAKDSDEHAR
ncbi:ABC transporter ATP-binding protein [Microbacterium resistens]|uniref:ABC transporter ATP-binding protein n=1 Tax=Microbacterium resistens TaxID=156977 RepID=UPI00082C2682|nr:ABC transporter ATP-binding protein [Microbacterium resistens]MBW1639421.1 ABC transporter ATP-binding protein [Microbacterium resistens]